MLHGIGDISDGESPASYLYGDRGTTVKVRGTAICDAITGQSRPAVILTLLHLAALHSCKVSHLFHGANTKTSFCTNEKCLICLFFNISAHTCIYSRDSFLKSDVLHTLHFQFSNPFGTNKYPLILLRLLPVPSLSSPLLLVDCALPCLPCLVTISTLAPFLNGDIERQTWSLGDLTKTRVQMSYEWSSKTMSRSLNLITN